MNPSKSMLDGWNLMSIILGENTGGQSGAAYVASIEDAINTYSNIINNSDPTTNFYKMYKSTRIDKQKGNVGEDFQAGTFNVDAAAKSSFFRAIKLGVNLDGSVDTVVVDVRTLTKAEWLNPAEHYNSIVEKAVERYQMKVYGNPIEGFNALADARYLKTQQQALTTQDAKEFLENDPRGIKHIVKKTNDFRPDVAEASNHAAETLTDRMEHDGVSSKSATNKRYEEMAKGSRGEKTYNPNDDGVSVANAIRVEDLAREALKGGATAAAITFALQLAPEIVKVIDYLVKHGEIDWKQIKQFGEKAIGASAQSFIRGSVASALVVAAKKGMLGEAFKALDATVIGAAVSIVMDTVINTIKLAAGKITARQLGMGFVDSTVMAFSFVGAMKVGGLIGQAIAPQLPIVGFLIGSLIGCSVGVLYNVGKNKLISFCKDSGFTCFGLVDQNYAVPDELLKEMGIETANIGRASIERASIDVLAPSSSIERVNVDTVSYKMVKRGIIGVNKVGYVI